MSRSALTFLVSLLLAGGQLCSRLEAEPIDFATQIQPILSENCYYCHGPDPEDRKADLRLDTEEGAREVLTSHEGKVSEFFYRLTTDDEDDLMPPPDSNRVVTPAQIKLIEQWIKEGAEWGRHWAFEPIEKPETQAGPEGAVDELVERKLKEAELTFSPEASPERLLRRVSLDLTGLPPSSDETKAFLVAWEKDSDAAYGAAVDRLLASPAFGERMAWDWLDAARYADTNGYQGDRERTMWPWRDWAVNAFNENMPYDQFSIWQIAGDLLPEATTEQKLATGFLRSHPINGEGGRIAEENRVDYVFDMSETVGTIWLGLTFNCCRCHDHKYDPLTQVDYFALNAFFNQTPISGGGGDPQTKPVLAMPTKEQTQQIAEAQKRQKEVAAGLVARSKALAGKQEEWEAKQAAEGSDGGWTALKPAAMKSQGGQKMEILDDSSILTSGTNPKKEVFTITLRPEKGQTIRGLRIEALLHESMTKGGAARSNSGNFVLTGLEAVARTGGEEQKIAFEKSKASYEQKGWVIPTTLDGKTNTGWAILESGFVNKPQEGVWGIVEPISVGEGTEIVLTLRHESPHDFHNLGRFRISLTEKVEINLAGVKSPLQDALAVAKDKRSDAQKKTIRDVFLASDVESKKLRDEDAKLKKRIEDLQKAGPKVMVMEDMEKPRETYILKRGLYTDRGEVVTAAVPGMLPPLPADEKANRLALAKWLFTKENPLTARVTVNRVWQQFFGIGLVKTIEDFGVQAEVPPNAELLDWLAADFRDEGWDLKRLIRQIVTSRTYRQSSKVSLTLLERDPENRLLARGARYRMPSWMIRDHALAASGLLVDEVGGAPVNGYQPPGIWEEASFGKKKYTRGSGEALYRRSLYTFWRRIIGPTLFFDSAGRQVCEVKSKRTNTPLHALTTLNDVTYVEAARHLAQEALEIEGKDDAGRLDEICRRLLGRVPDEKEREILMKGLARSREEFASEKEAATKLLSVGESKRNEGLDAVEHAAWTALSLAVMNLDEALSKE